MQKSSSPPAAFTRTDLFDSLVLLTSFLLGYIFPSLEALIRSPGFFNWILASLLLYTAGAVLKDWPLSVRLSTSIPVKPVPYVIFLVVAHWFIIFLLVVLAEPALRRVTGLPAITDQNQGSWTLIIIAAVAASIVTALVYRTKSNRRYKKLVSSVLLFRVELVADLLLIAGVSIFSFVFWEKGVMAMLSRAATRSIGDVWFLFIFLAMLFMLVYLPLRYLFFMENPAAGTNRKRFFLIFGFLLIRALFSLLNI